MANSSSDADIRLKATLDTGDVKEKLQEVGKDASTALDGAASSGDKLAKSMDEVGKSAKISAQQITAIAVSLSGMGLQLGASVLKSRGMDAGSQYLQGAGQGAMQGAAALSPLGPQAAIAGAVGGAAIGAGKTFFDRQAAEEERKAAEEALAASNREALGKFDNLRRQANESADFYATLASASQSAAEKQQALAERMREFQGRADELKNALRSDELQRDGKGFAETMQQYSAALREVDKARGASLSIREDKTSGMATSSRDLQQYSDALTRIGGSVGGGSVGDISSIQREGVEVAKSQLQVLQEIKADGLGTWG